MATKGNVAVASALLLVGLGVGYLLGASGTDAGEAHNLKADRGAAAATVNRSAAEPTDLPAAKRRAIEDAFPEFRDFESQQSFAGHSVDIHEDVGDHYVAYVVHGSGIPIAQATCFRVDRIGRVFQVGVFPDPVDSYVGHRGVDPRNCHGIP